MQTFEALLREAEVAHGHLCAGQILGVRMAIRKAYELDELPKPAEIEALAKSWRPYCSVAAWYLWRSLENQAAV